VARATRALGWWRADRSGHLLDLTHWLAGPLPLHSALLKTQFWDMPVEDNAALVLGDDVDRGAPWAMLHVTWTEWKNLFSIEVYCREAKLRVDGLVRSYGPQRLRIYRMGPEMGPPALEERTYATEDLSWAREWEYLAGMLADGDDGPRLLGDLEDARYAWSIIEAAYDGSPAFTAMRRAVQA
jgi:predicted dehydrogenase